VIHRATGAGLSVGSGPRELDDVQSVVEQKAPGAQRCLKQRAPLSLPGVTLA